MIIQDSPWGSGQWEADGVLYVDDRFACEREWAIFQGERNKALNRLTVQISPLLGTVTCWYHFPEGESETYELLIMHCQGIDALRLYRNDGGRYLPVHYGVVPFNYGELLNALHDLPDTKPFVEILENPALQWLAKRDFSLDRIVIVSELLRYDYPPVYWFILANARVAGKLVDGVMDRTCLAHCLGVTALQSSQLTAMRRLKMDECSDKVVGNALVVLAKQWPSIKPLLVHEPELDASLVCFLSIILDHIPDIIRCRWFTYQSVVPWLCCQPDSEYGSLSIESVASLFLVEWFILQKLAINPASLDSANRMYYVIGRELQRRVRSGELLFGQLQESVRSCIHLSLHSEIGQWFNQIGDYLYNDDGSGIWSDSDPFPIPRLWNMDTCFTPVATAGELRAIASRLDNCAASRVAIAMRGNAEFWMYQSDCGELALLQLEVTESDVSVAEFKGFQNAPVSAMAQVRLEEWLAINRIILARALDA